MLPIDVVSIGAAYLENILFSGIVLGWPSLQVVLEEVGYFQDRCENATNIDRNLTIYNTTSRVTDCDAKEASFNLVFTLSSAFLFFMLFPSGYILDKFGMWFSRCIFIALYLLGFILLSVSTPTTPNFLFPSIVLIGFSGSSLLLSNMQLVNLSKVGRGTLVALMDGTYESGTLIFYLIKKIYDYGVDLNVIFWTLTWLTIFPILKTFVLMPRRFVPFPLSRNFKYGWREWACFRVENIRKQEIQTKSLPEVVSLDDNKNFSKQHKPTVKQDKNLTFLQCIRNKLFWSSTFHYTLIAFRANFYLGSYVTWLKGFLSNSEVNKAAEMLNVVLLLSFPLSPLIGLLIDGVVKCAKRTTNVKKVMNLRGAFAAATVTSVLSILLSIMVLIPNVLASLVFLLLCKTYLYCSCTAFVLFLFPTEHLGKLYGLINFIAGVAFLFQIVVFRLTLTFDPSFRFIHLGFCALTVSTLIHPLLIFLESKKLERDSSQSSAQPDCDKGSQKAL